MRDENIHCVSSHRDGFGDRGVGVESDRDLWVEESVFLYIVNFGQVGGGVFDPSGF